MHRKPARQRPARRNPHPWTRQQEKAEAEARPRKRVALLIVCSSLCVWFTSYSSVYAIMFVCVTGLYSAGLLCFTSYVIRY